VYSVYGVYSLFMHTNYTHYTSIRTILQLPSRDAGCFEARPFFLSPHLCPLLPKLAAPGDTIHTVCTIHTIHTIRDTTRNTTIHYTNYTYYTPILYILDTIYTILIILCILDTIHTIQYTYTPAIFHPTWQLWETRLEHSLSNCDLVCSSLSCHREGMMLCALQSFSQLRSRDDGDWDCGGSGGRDDRGRLIGRCIERGRR
jgi:hypothetical protein